MPPRFAYWTILIDDKPTAFRAREREELQPTFIQLQRKSANVIMRWFARGKLWESRDAEREDFQRQRLAATAPRERKGDSPGAERRGSDWRPGGSHKDPRDRFKKKNRPERAWSEKEPSHPKPRDRRPWNAKPAPQNDRPWQTKPTGPRAQRKPWTGKPSGGSGWSGKPSGASPRQDRPWHNKPGGGGGRSGVHGRGDKPAGGSPGGPPWRNRPAGGGRRPWTGSTTGDQRKPFVPRGGPSRPRFDKPPRKKRNDDPDRD